jgi:hypothetical protein
LLNGRIAFNAFNMGDETDGTQFASVTKTGAQVIGNRIPPTIRELGEIDGDDRELPHLALQHFRTLIALAPSAKNAADSIALFILRLKKLPPNCETDS